MDKKELMIDLIDRIERLNYHYYTLDEPLLSDKEYDELYDQLIRLEEETGIVLDNSPSQKVGGEVLDAFEKHRHLARLWSLDKSQSYDELRDWERRITRLIDSYNEGSEEKLPSPSYIMEYKFDGLSINLTYDGGELIQAATRGNGEIGEGILSQVQVIRSIPKNIKFQGRMEVQGEGVMPLSALEAYNKTADEPLKNARNAAAGALRNLDTNITRERNLEAYFYNIGYIEGKKFYKHTEMLDFLRDNYIPVFPYAKEFNSMEELISEIELQDEKRKDLDILTDGMVIKLKDIRTRELLGYTNRFPRWAIAYKFEAEEVTTRLLEVIWNVGRTGKLTPSSILEPVEIAGATIRRATLNNIDDIERKSLKINSRVLLRRSNDVIPEILGALDPEDGDEELKDIKAPERCPACDSSLVRDGVHIFCLNSLYCQPQLEARIVHFASRDAMNIEGLSEKTARLLLEELGLKDIADIYELEFEDLMGLEGFKEKKSSNLLEAIEKSKKVSLSSFIYALGIRNVGVKTANDLADHYKSLDGIRGAEFEDLIEVGEIGEIIATSILNFFQDDHANEIIDRLLDLGVEPYYEDQDFQESILTDKAVVITGTIEGINRKEVKELAESMGAKVRSSVSRNTDYLIAGENAGSKYDRALELGVEIIDGERFKSIVAGK